METYLPIFCSTVFGCTGDNLPKSRVESFMFNPCGDYLLLSSFICKTMLCTKCTCCSQCRCPKLYCLVDSLSPGDQTRWSNWRVSMGRIKKGYAFRTRKNALR